MSNGTHALSRPDNIAPHSAEAESAVLGSVLINPDAYHYVASFLKSADFFIVRHAWIWDAIESLQTRGQAVDNLTLIEELRSYGQLETVGGAAYITQLINSTPTHIHIETYARIVERAAIRRRLLAAASEIAQTSLEMEAPIEQIIDHCEATLYGVTMGGRDQDLKPLRVLLAEQHEVVERMYNRDLDIVGLPTGFKELDHMIGGLEKSRVYIIAARPGMGKTSMMLNIASNAVKASQGHPLGVGIFSREMNADQLVRRLTCVEAKINSKKLKAGRLSEEEWGRFTHATGVIGNWPIFIDDKSITMNQVRARMRLWQREHGLDVVMVDYLQLLHADGKKANREAEVSEVARGLKELAREFNIPIIAAAQLNRALETRADKRPMLSDLRESGEIEQAADVVWFIYRDDKYNEHSERPNQADILVAKQRDGDTGVITLFFRSEFTEFTNMNKTEIDLTEL